MRRWFGRSFILLASLLAFACSSQQSSDDAGPAGAGGQVTTVAGTGGAPAPDRSCLDGSDGCVWSCGVGSESGTGDSPYPYCDADHKFACPTGSQPLSSCAPRSCALFGLYCCDTATGTVPPPACNADGFRATVCPDGSEPQTHAHCIPAGVSVVSCSDLSEQPCDTIGQECHSGAICVCRSLAGKAPAWDCPPFIP